MDSQPEKSKAPAVVWASGAVYEQYVGRWSRLVAPRFVEWLTLPADGRWLDVGCGTGVLTQAILQHANPRLIDGVDSSGAFLAMAKQEITDPRARFMTGDARALTVEDGAYEAVVSGLVINHMAHPEQAIAEMARAVRPGGVVAAYVWDYSGKMQLMRHFWNAAAALDARAAELDQGRQYPLCRPEPLTALWHDAKLHDVETAAIDIPTDFANFDDFWNPFTAGQFPAPAYAMSLSEDRRAALRERLRAALPFALDGSVPLVARAWAVRGVR